LAGLAPNNLRLPEPQNDNPALDDLVIEPEDLVDTENLDDAENVVSIEHGDGSVTISLDDKPLKSKAPNAPGGWFKNLVHDISSNEISRIAEDLLRGISDDIQSRAEWVEDQTQGLKLLGLKIEIPNTQGASDGAPVDGMSRVRHPLLLEAVLRFQANARSELLPTDGPVKVRNDDNNADLGADQLGDALEKDFNHYLTSTATEYYPDTDRMLLKLGFSGTAFKKVYFCPLRNRPVSESVDADDLIVNNAATDLQNAKRKTHRVSMLPSTVKRLQILGVYRDVDLSTPMAPTLDSLQREEMSQQGLADSTANPDDFNREIYECYCELDVKGFEHKLKGKETGLEIPYRVTIDVSSREILSIVRNYDEDTSNMPEQRKTFVKYTFVPGLGFYDIGLLHILGNTTNAITAAWREALDAGMFANFPGFLISKAASRQNTNIMRVPPGGGVQVDTNGMKIGDAVMQLPYKTPDAGFIQFISDIATTGMRIGGTSEQAVGEGRADAPVGTTLALIDQATKVLNSVHKRMHAAQAEEFTLLRDCFKENPESFWQSKGKRARKWDEATFLGALENCELVPQADPNTASHSQRIMKVMGLKQLQASSPALYDPIAVEEAALQTLGWNNPQQFISKTQAPPSPEVQEKIAKVEIEKQKAATGDKLANAKVAETQAKIQEGQKEGLAGGNQVDTEVDKMDAQTRRMDAELKKARLGLDAHALAVDDENQDKDRAADDRRTLIDLAESIVDHPGDAKGAGKKAKKIEKEVG
jgi:hypothetical protein